MSEREVITAYEAMIATSNELIATYRELVAAYSELGARLQSALKAYRTASAEQAACPVCSIERCAACNAYAVKASIAGNAALGEASDG